MYIYVIRIYKKMNLRRNAGGKFGYECLQRMKILRKYEKIFYL